jgi:hypothetical protein
MLRDVLLHFDPQSLDLLVLDVVYVVDGASGYVLDRLAKKLELTTS